MKYVANWSIEKDGSVKIHVKVPFDCAPVSALSFMEMKNMPCLSLVPENVNRLVKKLFALRAFE